MRLKTFAALTMNDAMDLVRQTLGEDAVIVSTKQDDLSKQFLVTAALEQFDENLIAGATDPSHDLIDIIDVICQALDQHGVPYKLSEKLLHAASTLYADDPAIVFAGALDSCFAFHPIPLQEKGRYALVGMPGAGKTVTTAKLATLAYLKKTPIQVISLDLTRAGGIDQLKSFTRLLNVPLMAASNLDETKTFLNQHDAELVLVDTPGVNLFDPQEVSDLRAKLTILGVEPIWVMPAGLDVYEASDMAHIVHESLDVKRLITTRVDFARRLGALLGAVPSFLAFSHFGIAPEIGEGLKAATPMALAKLLLYHGVRGGAA